MDVDLMMLQERCKKDPVSYREEFLMQRRHFTALLNAAKLQPSEPSPRLVEVASFMGCVAPNYRSEGSSIAPPIIALLSESGPAMNPDLRRALVRLLALMRARDVADAAEVITLFFSLLSCNDKVLRRMLHGHIISDLKRLQASGDAARRSLQAFLFEMVADPSEVLVKRSLHVLVDLFRKRIWNDSRCANMIASACFHPSTPVAVISTKFLLDSTSKDKDYDSEESDDEETLSGNKSHDSRKAADMWKAYGMTSKKTTKKRKRMQRVIARATKAKTGQSSTSTATDQASSAAMALLNDPQQFAEKLFSDLQTRRKKEKFETRLVFLNLLTRLVGTYQLILFNLYPYLQRYLQPAQPEVTRTLAYLTQACHDLVPSDVLHPILRSIADIFVSERSSPPSMAAGINTIRAICARVPLAILDAENEDKPEEDQEAPLLEDLVEYKSEKDKGVMMAARSLIALYREVHPRLLRKGDRGRFAAEAVQKGKTGPAPAYSALRYSTGVEGAEYLQRDSDEDEDVCDDSEKVNLDVRESSDSERSSISDEIDEEADVGANELAFKDEDSLSDRDAQPDTDGEIDDVDDGSANDKSDNENEAVAVKGLGKRGAISSQIEREDTKRIFTDEDFAKIRARQAAKAVEGAVSMKTRDAGESVNPEDLQGVIKRERKTLEQRLESVLAGREGREKYGSRKGKNKGGGSTNKKKLKTKANSMVLHKRRKNSKAMSRRERQIAKRKKRDYR